MKKILRVIAILSMLFMMVGCGDATEETNKPVPLQTEVPAVLEETDDLAQDVEEVKDEEIEAESDVVEQEPDLIEQNSITDQITTAPAISISDVPVYAGNAYAVINDNVPYFADNELSTTSYEYYSDLDSMGRCGVCVANVGQDIMPTEDRGEIGSVKPTGWHTVKYNNLIDGNYLYNRCHLIGFQLTGENANEKNLITGTRYLNVEGMLPFENMVADYVKETENHVMYRVTPVFDGDNLVAFGVLMEAKSVEDNGDGILFNVFCYNIQPGIAIDYASGNSELDGSIVEEKEDAPTEEASNQEQIQEETSAPEEIQEVAPIETPQPAAEGTSYVLNTNTKKFHYIWCSSVNQMKAKNREDFTGSRDDVIARGFVPCKKCNP